MGQSTSSNSTPLLLDVGKITQDELAGAVQKLNLVTSRIPDAAGKRLRFKITQCDDVPWWKWSAKITCHTVAYNNKTLKSRDLGIRQFARLYTTIMQQAPTGPDGQIQDTASVFLDRFEDQHGAAASSECVICLDHPSEITLSCTHDFCRSCIESWGTESRTCPICRTRIDNPDSHWELVDYPRQSDFGTYLSSTME